MQTRSEQSSSASSRLTSPTVSNNANKTNSLSRAGSVTDAKAITKSSQANAKSGDDDKRKSAGDAKDDDRDDGKPDVAIAPEPPDDEPPRTMVEWWNRISKSNAAAPLATSSVTPLFSPAGGASNQANASKTPVSGVAYAPVKADAAKGTNAQPASRTTPNGSAQTSTAKTAANSSNTQKSGVSAYNGAKVRAADPGLFELGRFRQREILASGLDQTALSKVEAMGFKAVAAVRTPSGPGFVRSLTIPMGISEAAAARLLGDAIPEGNFGPNHVYRIYPAGDDVSETVFRPAGEGPVAAPKQCRGPDCVAHELIGWKPSLGECARSVRIGVIDTSFDMSHPALRGRKFVPKDFRAHAMDFKKDWHGTAVLSVLAGEQGSATPGLVPAAEFYLASTFGADASGQASADALSVLSALAWLDGKVEIINMSFSGPRNGEIEKAIQAMSAKGVIFVAAAGNRPNGPPSYPAAYDEVIAVTAVGKDREGYRYATHGDYVDVAAPGVDVLTALPQGRTGLRTGTSFATPFVTALIAAMPAARKNAHTKFDVLARMSKRDLGEPGRDPTYGEGLPLAPDTCDEIGGVAALPWSPEAKRLAAAQTAPARAPSTTSQLPSPPVLSFITPSSVSPSALTPSISTESAMGFAHGFAP